MKFDVEDFEDIERDRSFGGSSNRPRKKRRFFRFVGYFLISVVIVLAIGYLTLKFLVGPIVKTVDALPDNFPKDLSIYELESANVYFQDPDSRHKVISGLRSMPDWVLTLFLNVLSDDLKRELVNNFGENIDIDNNFDVNDLKEAFKSVDLDRAQTVNLSWQGLGKTKEEIAAFYKDKLAEANFEFKENLEDYEINLGFWKDGVFGIMSFADSKESRYNTDVDMTVNYFDELK